MVCSGDGAFHNKDSVGQTDEHKPHSMQINTSRPALFNLIPDVGHTSIHTLQLLRGDCNCCIV